MKSTRNRYFKTCVLQSLIIILLFVLNSQSWANNYWSQHDPRSPNRIDHSLWGEILRVILVPYENVKDQVSASKWDCRTTGSRIPKCDIGIGKTNNLKGVNLVGYKYFKPEFVYYIRNYLENMSKMPISSYTRNEQLAFWLNIHNAAVILKIYEHYPADSIYNLRDIPRKDPTEPIPWTENFITVEGRKLSIRDIEKNVIFENWKDPSVIYGLFDGSVGGPTLPRSPYVGSLVHAQLEMNAENFVNSPRVLRFRGEVATVSTVYGWAHSLFDGSKGILTHIAALRPSLAVRMRRVERVRETFYDYEIAAFAPRDDAQDRMVLDRIVDFNGGNFGSGASPF